MNVIHLMGFFTLSLLKTCWVSAMGTKQGLSFDEKKDKVSKTKEEECVREGFWCFYAVIEYSVFFFQFLLSYCVSNLLELFV